MLDTDHRNLYVQLYCDSELMRHIGPPLSETRAERAFGRSLLEQEEGHGRRLNWIATETATRQRFAIAGLTLDERRLSAEIGCILLATHHGQGFATELLGCLVDLGFETLGLEIITTFSTLENIGTRIFLDRLGFDRKRGVRDGTEGYHWSIER